MWAALVLGASQGPFAAKEGRGDSDLGRMEMWKKGSMDGQDGQIKVRMRREGQVRETGGSASSV